MIAISNGQELRRDEEIQFIYALGDLTVTGTNLPALNLEAEQLLIVEKETQETELHIMFHVTNLKALLLPFGLV